LCCGIDDKLYELVRAYLVLGLQNAELGDLEHLLRLLVHDVVSVLYTNLDILSCAVDRNAGIRVLLIEVKRY
jgi:hypothetical protein